MESKFFYCTDSIRKVWNKYDVFFSMKFCNYFADRIEEILYREGGLKASYKVSLSAFKPYNDQPMYEPGPISKINTAISILPMFTGNISFCWKSKTGPIVHTYDEEFEENDLECWIEGLNPALYWEQLTTVSTNHPLKLKNLPYELTVYGFGMHMGLTIQLSDINKAEEIINKMDDYVEDYNQKSEDKDWANGVIHSHHGKLVGSEIIYRLDVGSAGVVFVKKLLRLLAKYVEVNKVTVDL